MMKNLTVFVVLFSMAFCLFPVVVPAYHGARSLSLGYSTTAANFDINAIFINPALLATARHSVTGYQYLDSYIDYQDFVDDLNSILEYDLKNFTGINESDKADLFSRLEDLFQSKSGIYGFRSNLPGFASRGYGISIGVVKTAIINPVENDIFSKGVDNITNDDIASLKMNFLGLSYKQVSFSYALPVSQGFNVGITLHYLNGKLKDYNSSIIDDVFTGDTGVRTFLQDCWGSTEEKFSRILMDIGFSMNFGMYFNAGINYKNFGGAKIKTSEREIALNKRVTAGLAFTPDPRWRIYLDMDITKTDLLYSGKKMQPLSLGVEKGFFKNKFFLRAGFLTDLTDRYFVGTRSNVLYGIGFGFNLASFIVDFGLGTGGDGSVNNLAISGFFILK